MLTDDEIYQAIDQVQLGDGASQSFVLAVGRAIEARVLEKLIPTPEMVRAFQEGFAIELHKPDKRRKMTAEEAGLRAMLAAARKAAP